MKTPLCAITVVALAAVLWSNTDAANPRNRNRLGYRGRQTQQLVGRQPNGMASLRTSLTAYFKLEESSTQPRVDSTGGTSLTPVNLPGSTTGVKGNASQFVAAGSTYLTRVDDAAASMGDIDFTVACWVRLSDTSSIYVPVCKFSASLEYEIDFRSDAGNVMRFYCGDGAGGHQGSVDSGAVSAGSFFLVIVWHDATANTVNISINNGATVSNSYTFGSADGASPFEIGRRTSGSTLYLNGTVDEVGVWKRVLTAAERTRLYNSGAGVTYPNF